MTTERPANGSPEQRLGGTSGDHPDVSLNDDVLPVQQRRHLLYCLCTYANPIALPSIADQLTVWDGAFETDTEYLQRRLQIYDSLYYDHVPLLSSGDLILYDQSDDMVRGGPAFEQCRSTIADCLRTEIEDLLQAERATLDTEFP